MNNIVSNAQSIVLLALRLWVAKIFLTAALLKLTSWEATLDLFANDYPVPLLPPNIAAVLGTGVELIAGSMLVIGFLTPLAALGLFCLTLVIELFVYPGTNDHYNWLLMLGVLMVFGGGKLSLDKLFSKFYGNIYNKYKNPKDL